MRPLLLILCLILPTLLFGHGVIHQELRNGYGLQISFDDGSPLDFADIQIFRPQNEEEIFQEGMTDINGVFMFKPDAPGLWTLKVSDGFGHGKIIEILVDKQNLPSSDRGNLSWLGKLITGLGYLFFIFGAWYFLLLRRRSNHAHS